MFSGFMVFFGIFLVFVFLATTAEERFGRACKPVIWTGNVVESITMLIHDDWTDNVRSGFKSADYGCRFTVWRFFYEEDYIKYQKHLEEQSSMSDSELEEAE